MLAVTLPRMTTLAERIQQRLEATGKSARSASLEAGLSDAFVRNILKGKADSPRGENLAKLARVLGTSMNWLLNGSGEPETGRDPNLGVLIGGYISAGGAIDTSSEQVDPGIEYEAHLMYNVPGAVAAYQVVGSSMYPRFMPDTVIICGGHSTDADALIDEEVAVGTPDGGRYLKILRKGSRPGVYDLESFNAPTMRDVELAWIAEIRAIIPAKQWRRIEREVG